MIGFAQRLDFKPFADNFTSLTQAVGVADHQRITNRTCFRLCQCLHDHLGPDTGWISHGNRNGWGGYMKFPLALTARRRSLIRTRVCSSPNAPAFVEIGTDNEPRVNPSG